MILKSTVIQLSQNDTENKYLWKILQAEMILRNMILQTLGNNPQHGMSPSHLQKVLLVWEL